LARTEIVLPHEMESRPSRLTKWERRGSLAPLGKPGGTPRSAREKAAPIQAKSVLDSSRSGIGDVQCGSAFDERVEAKGKSRWANKKRGKFNKEIRFVYRTRRPANWK
jgi:hypothetical protein